MHLGGTSLPQRILAEEEHETRTALIHRAPLTLDQRYTLNDVRELNLFMACELWDANFGKLLVDCNCRLLGKDFVLCLIADITIQVRSVGLVRCAPWLSLSKMVSIWLHARCRNHQLTMSV